MVFGLRRVKVLGYVSVQLVSTISDLCDPDPSTLQTHVMDEMHRALHYSASRGKTGASDDIQKCKTIH